MRMYHCGIMFKAAGFQSMSDIRTTAKIDHSLGLALNAFHKFCSLKPKPSPHLSKKKQPSYQRAHTTKPPFVYVYGEGLRLRIPSLDTLREDMEIRLEIRPGNEADCSLGMRSGIEVRGSPGSGDRENLGSGNGPG